MLQAGKDFEYFNFLAKVEMHEANLPHWYQPHALYFVTFRLADSIPKEKLSQWKHEFEQWLTRNPKPWNKEQLDEYQTHFARKIEVWLDRGYGSNLFRDPSYAQIVEDCLLKFDRDRYKIDCYTIASNHAHALVVPTRDNELHGILKSLKGVSARTINKVRRTNGTIWQKRATITSSATLHLSNQYENTSVTIKRRSDTLVAFQPDQKRQECRFYAKKPRPLQGTVFVNR